MTESSLIGVAASELESAGFFVQSNARVETVGKRLGNIDVIAWAPNEDGELTRNPPTKLFVNCRDTLTRAEHVRNEQVVEVLENTVDYVVALRDELVPAGARFCGSAECC